MSGFPTINYTHTKKTVAVTSTELVAANLDRKFLLVQNISDTDVDIKIGAAAVAEAGDEAGEAAHGRRAR